MSDCSIKLPVLGGSQSEKEKSQPTPVKASDYSGNALLVTLGCAKNLVDSEVMLGVMKQKGFNIVTEPEFADLIVVNTCAFLESAVNEGVDRILELAEYKKTARCRQLVVAGCMVERYREELVESLPEVDRFISTDDLLSVTDGVDAKEVFDEARRPYFLYDENTPRVISTDSHSAFVKVSEGCNRPCSFCIIPKIRGSLRSRSIPSVLAEVGHLREQNVKEFNLVAQDLTAYGEDLEEKSNLAMLLSGLDSLSKDENQEPFWVRLFYAYPVGTNDELLKAIVESDTICNYLDIPLQHISKPVLKAMRRPLGAKGTRQLVEKITKEYPQIAIRTTFIVGFPGETEEDVDELEEFVSRGHFSHVGVFTYSQEKEAVSYTFDDQIADDVKEARRARVMKAQQEVLKKKLEDKVGTR